MLFQELEDRLLELDLLFQVVDALRLPLAPLRSVDPVVVEPQS